MAKLTPSYLILLVVAVATCSAVKITDVDISQRVEEGKSAFLKCEYDLEGEELKSVKWFFRDEEIFR